MRRQVAARARARWLRSPCDHSWLPLASPCPPSPHRGARAPRHRRSAPGRRCRSCRAWDVPSTPRAWPRGGARCWPASAAVSCWCPPRTNASSSATTSRTTTSARATRSSTSPSSRPRTRGCSSSRAAAPPRPCCSCRRAIRSRSAGPACGSDRTARRSASAASRASSPPTRSMTRWPPRCSARGPLYVPLDQTTRDEQRIRELTFAGRDVRNLRPSADSLRLVKDADEIARMRKAVDISGLGHIAAMQAARPGVWEYEIEAALEAAFRRNGADRVGYPSIVGSGPNSTTLHYDVNRRQTRDGDLVVVDAGAEWGQYTADVTRTFPVNGKFTQRQKAIYDLVLATQQAAFDSTRPGTTIAQLNRV